MPVAATHPEACLRIPGRWRSLTEVATALPAGYSVDAGILTLPDGSTLALTAMGADDQFPEVFASACRFPLCGRARRAVQRYRMNAAIVGRAGSRSAARRLLAAAGAMVRAGGIGVFVDNGLVAHEGRDVLALAGLHEPKALREMFVNATMDSSEFRSIGMHVLGLREVVLERSGDDESDWDAFADFVCYATEGDAVISAGDNVFAGGRTFTVEIARAARPCPGTPPHNPYGQWKLRPTDRGGGGDGPMW